MAFLSDRPEPVRDSVELAVSELATNAVCHACTDFDLEIYVGDRGIRVQVADGSCGEPKFQEQSRFARGRGLQIVRAISDDFGVIDRPGSGKAIWCEINGSIR